MIYDPDIPQAPDIIATSQGQLLTNYQQLNTVYGTSGDHYPFDNNNPGERHAHAKITMPRLPTANVPGNVVPTPPANIGVIYSKAAVSQTIPYYRKDNTTIDWPLLSLRAMGLFNYTTGAVIGTAFNLEVSAGAGTAAPTLSFTLEDMPDTNYLIFIQDGRIASQDSAVTYNTNTIAVGSFRLLFNRSVVDYSVMVLHYA